MIVKRIMIALACAMIAPIAFAQTSTSTTERTTTTAPDTATTTETTTYSAGTVTTYEPGKTIVVHSAEGPVSFALGTAARIVNGAGTVVTARSGLVRRYVCITPAPVRSASWNAFLSKIKRN